jgi:hypothetical protein
MITSKQLSQYRQTVRNLVDKIDRLSSRCLYLDELIHGSPTEVFRKCGRANCKCANSPEDRHGPYKVIQVIRDGKSRQICLRKEQEDLWELAKRYQFQTDKLDELKTVCQELQTLVTEVIEKRLRDFP